MPLREVILTKDTISNFKLNYIKNSETQNENKFNNLYEDISNGVYHNGCENWLPLFYKNNLVNIDEYIPNDSNYIYNYKLIEKISIFIKEIKNYYELRKSDNFGKYNPVKINSLYSDFNDVMIFLNKKLNIVYDIENIIKNEREMFIDFKKIPNFSTNNKEVFIELMNFLNK